MIWNILLSHIDSGACSVVGVGVRACKLKTSTRSLLAMTSSYFQAKTKQGVEASISITTLEVSGALSLQIILVSGPKDSRYTYIHDSIHTYCIAKYLLPATCS